MFLLEGGVILLGTLSLACGRCPFLCRKSLPLGKRKCGSARPANPDVVACHAPPVGQALAGAPVEVSEGLPPQRGCMPRALSLTDDVLLRLPWHWRLLPNRLTAAIHPPIAWARSDSILSSNTNTVHSQQVHRCAAMHQQERERENKGQGKELHRTKYGIGKPTAGGAWVM